MNGQCEPDVAGGNEWAMTKQQYQLWGQMSTSLSTNHSRKGWVHPVVNHNNFNDIFWTYIQNSLKPSTASGGHRVVVPLRHVASFV